MQFDIGFGSSSRWLIDQSNEMISCFDKLLYLYLVYDHLHLPDVSWIIMCLSGNNFSSWFAFFVPMFSPKLKDGKFRMMEDVLYYFRLVWIENCSMIVSFICSLYRKSIELLIFITFEMQEKYFKVYFIYFYYILLITIFHCFLIIINFLSCSAIMGIHSVRPVKQGYTIDAPRVDKSLAI